MIKASEIRKEGTKGTTVCNLGGIGLGYELSGKVYFDGGNGFYYEKKNLKTFIADNGKAYMNAARGIFPNIDKGVLV